MWGAVLGGALSAGIGALGSNSAADKQATTARKQLKLAKKTYKKTVEQSAAHVAAAERDAAGLRTGGKAAAQKEFSALSGLATDLRGRTLAGAATARNDARDAFRGAHADALGDLRAGKGEAVGALRDARMGAIGEFRVGRENELAALRDARMGAIGEYQDGRDNQLNALRGAMDASLGAYGDAYRTARGDVISGRDAAIGELDPLKTRGDNALAAYSYNLGLGTAPKGYTGPALSEGERFIRDEGMTTVQGSAAARGGLNSGETLEALNRLGSGIASQSRDRQQQELFALGGLGATARDRIASLYSGAGGDLASLATGYGDRVAGARDAFGTRSAAVEGDYARSAAAARDAYGTRAAGVYGDYATNAAAARDAYGLRVAGVADDYATRAANMRLGLGDKMADTSRNYFLDTLGANSGYAANMGAIQSGLTDRSLGLDRAWMDDVTGARTTGLNALIGAGSQYGQNAGTALANRGDALAAGSVGVANALQNGLNTGLGIWAYNRGNSTAPAAGTNMLANQQNPLSGGLGGAVNGLGGAVSSFGNWLSRGW